MQARTKTVIMLVIILLPLAIFFILRTGTQHFDTLSIVGEKKAVVNPDGSVDTLYHTVYEAFPQFNFLNQNGTPLSWEEFKGHIVVVGVFFSRDKSFSPKLSRGMASIQKYFKDDPDVILLSITVDPVNDTLEVLQDFAGIYGAKEGKWHLITGKQDDLYLLANNAFFLKAGVDPEREDSFIHDNRLMLVDKEGRLRKGTHFWDGTNLQDVELLIDEIKVLKIDYAAQKRNE